eukprot:CAMPEP_0194182730 /NCGR_PEP_ID=MMETSP0154-20130528/26601_1 /TAXON_ID=1049557 /ORGANISM="Thalassiothrix antarctica, Strain L6-D1" /LENGTH=134 /DNA_ID=CAMNT_0038899177 /DNA_START=26 /DNA_END=426 /DNA_ORIENTATION=+
MSMVSKASEKRPASPAEMEVSPKRRKTSEISMSTTIQRSELDSALALASLALNSPDKQRKRIETTPEKTPVDQERETDVSPKKKNEEKRAEAAPVTPGSPSKSRRVKFSNDVRSDTTPPMGNISNASEVFRRRR